MPNTTAPDADGEGLLDWVASAPKPPRVTFMVHGRPERAQALGAEVEKRFGSRVFVPEMDEEFDLMSLLDE